MDATLTVTKILIVPPYVKKCPTCITGGLVVKMNNDDGSKFLGCTEFPHCKHTEPLPMDIQMKLQGAPMLPGME